MNKTNTEILDTLIALQHIEETPWLRATAGLATMEEAKAFRAQAIADPRTPDDIQGVIHTIKDWGRPSWSSSPHGNAPDWFQVELTSEEAGIAQATKDLESEYPVLRRFAG